MDHSLQEQSASQEKARCEVKVGIWVQRHGVAWVCGWSRGSWGAVWGQNGGCGVVLECIARFLPERGLGFPSV